MTRVLSDILGASEPTFSLGLMQLEQSAGRPSADVRLTAEIIQSTQAKLKELGLDPHDTTGVELYASLSARLQADEAQLAKALQGTSTKNTDIIALVIRRLQSELTARQCFAIKNVVAKKLLKSNVPKKTMKALGYRSADSMLKHESVAGLYAAATLLETQQWLKKQVTSYSKLKVSDFESRAVSLEHPTSKRWQELAETVVKKNRHNIISFPELGSVVLLPLPAQGPELPALTTTVLTLHAVHDIYASSTYLKLHQVKTKFGQIVRDVVEGKAMVSATLLDEPISWHLVQQYFARFSQFVDASVLEPVVHAEDFAIQSIEQQLSRIEPSLAFWAGTTYLALLDGEQPVSCNLTDQVLSHCNGLSFEDRVHTYLRKALSTEISLRYMQPDRLGAALGVQLQKQLAVQPAIA